MSGERLSRRSFQVSRVGIWRECSKCLLVSLLEKMRLSKLRQPRVVNLTSGRCLKQGWRFLADSLHLWGRSDWSRGRSKYKLLLETGTSLAFCLTNQKSIGLKIWPSTHQPLDLTDCIISNKYTKQPADGSSPQDEFLSISRSPATLRFEDSVFSRR